jgi:hypothetical protein
MATENPNTRPKKAKEPTPFQKFDALAKRVIRVPKDQMRTRSEKASGRPNR